MTKDHAAAPLGPIARSSAVDACAGRLRRSILEGELASGAGLPPERALASQLGVSRVTVRSALSRLASEGLLEVRQGSGHAVRDWRREGGPALLVNLSALAGLRGRAQVVADLLLVRRQLARAVLERLAQAPPGRAQAAIAEAVARFAEQVAAGAPAQALATADVEVLAAIVAATRSPVLQLCINPVLGVVRALPGLAEAIYADAAMSVAAYEALLAWLRAPNASEIDAIVEALALRDEITVARLSRGRR